MGILTTGRAIGRFIPSWLAGAVATTVLAVLLQTQAVIGRLNGIGAEIGLGERLAMSAYDVFRLGSFYIIFIAIGMLVAYLFGLLVYRLAGFGRWIIFAVAGAVAMFVMLMAMKQAFFDIHMIAGARDGFGIGLQMIAGAVGGLVFAMLTARQSASQPRET